MKKILILSAVVLAVMTSFSMVAFKTSGQKGEIKLAQNPVPNHYIVVLEEDVIGYDASAPRVDSEAQYLSAVYGGTVNRLYSSALKGFSVEMTPEQAELMNSDERVRSMEQDAYVSISSTQTNAPWNLDRVDQRNLPLDTSYGYTPTGSGVHVYIIDTGIRTSHVEFGSRASVAVDLVGDGQNGQDCNGHGTHVAGLASSATYGVAKNAFVHSVRVLGCSGTGTMATMLGGIDWVTANRVIPAVANISFTIAGTSSILETAVTNSIASGVTYTIAAGNNAFDACSYTPGRTPNALTVGGTAQNDDRALYSNYGPCLDLFAPAHQITSVGNGSDTATRVLSGTSMSAPMVAGAAALYLETNPTASPAAVETAIKNAATNGVVTLIDGTSPNKLLYSWLTGGPAPTPTPTPSATPTPTPAPVSPAQVRIAKRLQNVPSGPSSTTAFPYVATLLASSNFTLTQNAEYLDPNVMAFGSPISVTEAPVTGWRLVAIACAETPGNGPTLQNSTVELANGRANIVAEAGEVITCTFTSEPFGPTAATASVTGQVTTPRGQGLRSASVRIYDANMGQTRHAITNSQGYFTFEDLPTGHFYQLAAIDNKKYVVQSEPQSFTLLENLTGMNFIAVRR